VYALRGLSGDPLPKGGIRIDCVARQDVRRRIAVPSVSPFGVCRNCVVTNIGSGRGESQHTIFPQDATGALVAALPSPALPSSKASKEGAGAAEEADGDAPWNCDGRP
jgi:hypothetical protein